mmetsp:Transcript_51220/g.151005  ORF Transcript_51220/g.151005 Transcript_51220/m.151005 type:complete len:382 (+) Transcript_51220:866-2011(+)
MLLGQGGHGAAAAAAVHEHQPFGQALRGRHQLRHRAGVQQVRRQQADEGLHPCQRYHRLEGAADGAGLHAELLEETSAGAHRHARRHGGILQDLLLLLLLRARGRLAWYERVARGPDHHADQGAADKVAVLEHHVVGRHDGGRRGLGGDHPDVAGLHRDVAHVDGGALAEDQSSPVRGRPLAGAQEEDVPRRQVGRRGAEHPASPQDLIHRTEALRGFYPPGLLRRKLRAAAEREEGRPRVLLPHLAPLAGRRLGGSDLVEPVPVLPLRQPCVDGRAEVLAQVAEVGGVLLEARAVHRALLHHELLAGGHQQLGRVLLEVEARVGPPEAGLLLDAGLDRPLQGGELLLEALQIGARVDGSQHLDFQVRAAPRAPEQTGLPS